MSLLNFVKSKSFLKQLIFAVIGLVVFLFILIKWLNISTNHNQKIQVPDLAKMSISEVENTLKDLDLRLKIIDSSNYNPDYPPRSVIEQNPEAGDFVKENRQIYLKVNRPTYKDINIPNVLKLSRRNAETTLKAVGFRVGKNPKYVPDIARNVVRGLYHNGKEIKVGEQLPKNSVIDLKLGDGKGK
ncbi:PASTA domain-containing protein [Urechidicola croceus]|uniref:Serine/threonine protein kinase n=1 Tax=Urechidicola croceus TaxID=1850246 RepID=A0A1D8PBD7_9FLAO|nr:PASTA domain-containing protein [Urechidicola croceus]AOW21889.1 serine/threonine protein kinase [Urechidicola croceus]